MTDGTPLWAGRSGSNDARVVSTYGTDVRLEMKSPTGRWTAVQTYGGGGGHHAITKSGSFNISSECMREFLRVVSSCV